MDIPLLGNYFSMLMVGPPGCGKSTLLHKLIAKAVHHRVPQLTIVVYISCDETRDSHHISELFAKIRTTDFISILEALDRFHWRDHNIFVCRSSISDVLTLHPLAYERTQKLNDRFVYVHKKKRYKRISDISNCSSWSMSLLDYESTGDSIYSVNVKKVTLSLLLLYMKLKNQGRNALHTSTLPYLVEDEFMSFHGYNIVLLSSFEHLTLFLSDLLQLCQNSMDCFFYLSPFEDFPTNVKLKGCHTKENGNALLINMNPRFLIIIFLLYIVFFQFVSYSARLVHFLCMLILLAGDIETNPGPTGEYVDRLNSETL